MPERDDKKRTAATAETLACPVPHSDHGFIQMSHGSGGKLTDRLVSDIFIKHFDNEALNQRDDQATVTVSHTNLSFSTDSYVVDPIFFPGGNIGELAVNGTINDICMNGARPLYLSAGFILEEGLPLTDLEAIVASMAASARSAGVTIVTGDTKVVDRGKGDKIYINTSGIGVIEHDFTIAASNVHPGDVLILSGPIASHGIAVLSRRKGLAFESSIESDTAALNGLVEVILKAGAASIHAMRDPTRGGVAAVLNEWAGQSQVGIQLTETAIPIQPAVKGACELLGIDPLYVANEVKVIVAVDAGAADAVLHAMRGHPCGKDSCVIGRVLDNRPGSVTMVTSIGAERFVDMPVGEQLPRIC